MLYSGRLLISVCFQLIAAIMSGALKLQKSELFGETEKDGAIWSKNRIKMEHEVRMERVGCKIAHKRKPLYIQRLCAAPLEIKTNSRSHRRIFYQRSIGGGGGIRTRVRKPSDRGIYARSLCFVSPARAPAGRISGRATPRLASPPPPWVKGGGYPAF